MDSLLLGRGVYKVEPVIPDPLFTGDSANVVLDAGAVSELLNIDGTQTNFFETTPANRPTLGANGGIAFGENLRLTQVSNTPTTYTKFTLSMWVYLPNPFTPTFVDGIAALFADYIITPTRGILWCIRRLSAPDQKGFFYVIRDASSVGAGGAFVEALTPEAFDALYLGRWLFVAVSLSGNKLSFFIDGKAYVVNYAGNGVQIGNAGEANLGSFLTSRYLPDGTEIEAPFFAPYAMSATELYLKQKQDLIDYPYLST